MLHQSEVVKCEGEPLTMGADAVETSRYLSSACGEMSAAAASTATGDELAKSDVIDAVSHTTVSSGAESIHKTVHNYKPLDLVWCFDQCFKPVLESLRERVRQGAKDNGALLVMFKKAVNFAIWLGAVGGPASRSPGAAGATLGGELAAVDPGPYWRRRAHGPLRPYVLLASWQEAKGCLQALACKSWPLFMVVVCCGTARGFGNALAWAAGLNSLVWGQVWVTDSWETALKIATRQMNAFLLTGLLYSPPNMPPFPMCQPFWGPQALDGTGYMLDAWMTSRTSMPLATDSLPLYTLPSCSTYDELSETMVDTLLEEMD